MREHQSMKRKHKKLILIGFLIILLAALGGWGNFYYAKDRQISRIVTALRDPKQNMSQLVTASTPDMKVTNASLKPLQNYFKKRPQALRQLAQNLRHDRDDQEIGLTQSGRYFLFFPKYTLWVQCYRPQIETNNAHSQLTVNQHQLGTMQGGNQNYYQDLGLVFPGRYHVLVKTKVHGRQLTADSIVNIWSNKTVDMTIRTATFQVRSVPQGWIYVNDRRVAQLDKNGQYTFKDYPLAKHMEIYVKARVDGNTIKSEPVTDLSQSISSEFSDSDDDVNDYDSESNYQGNHEKDVYQDDEGDYIVNPLWPGLIQIKTAAKILYDNFKKPSAAAFINGKDNSDYQKLVDQVKTQQKSRALKGCKLAIKVQSVLPQKKNYSRVDYQVSLQKKRKHKVINKEILSYHQAIFQQVKGEQKIQTLGACRLIKTNTKD